MAKPQPAQMQGRGSAHDSDLPIFKFIAERIEYQKKANGKTQLDIAREVGYDQPAMVAMWKAGKVKVPLDKIPLLAKSLEVDPALLFRLGLPQFWPGAEKAIGEIFGTTLSEDERAFIEKVRAIMKDDPIPKLTREKERQLKAVLRD